MLQFTASKAAMLLAVNYSAAAADLLRRGAITFDYFKCPAWSHMFLLAQAMRPVYLHLPLITGSGGGDVIDTETKGPPDWEKYERLLEQTGTPMVNLHLDASVVDYPDIPLRSAERDHVVRVTDGMIRDVQAVVRRLGAERVIVENDYDYNDRYLWAAHVPDAISRVVEETGCGFLLDLSHARIAARQLGMDGREYIARLPVTRIREMHLTGIQRFDGPWIERLSRFGVDQGTLDRLSGRLIDHMPLTYEDWEFAGWAIERIRHGLWAVPWVVTFEFGGVGGTWEAMADRGALVDQVPQLYRLVKGGMEISS